MFPVIENFNNLKSTCQKNNAVSRSCPFSFVGNIMLLSASWQEANSMNPGYAEFINLNVILCVTSAQVIVMFFMRQVRCVSGFLPEKKQKKR